MRKPADPELASEGAPPGAAPEPMPGSPEDRIALGDSSLREHTARGVIINAAFQVGFAAVNLFERFAVAVFLTASEFGVWGIVLTTIMTLVWLKEVGISDRYVQQDEPDQEQAFQKAFTLELFYTLIFVAFVCAVLPVYALVYDQPEIVPPALVLCIAIIAWAFNAPLWIAFRQMRFVRQRLIEGINPVLGTLITVPLAAAGLGYWSLVIGMTAAAIVGATVAVATSPYRLAIRFDRATLREYVGFSAPLLVSAIAGIVVVQGTLIVGNVAVGLAGVGALALAASLVTFADRVDQVVSRSIYPAVCAVKDETGLLFEAFIKSNRLALIVGLPAGVGLFLFAPDLVELVLGEKWRPAQGMLQAFGLIVAVRQVAFNWGVFMAATGRTRAFAINGVTLLAVFAAVTVPAILLLGLDGFIVGASASLVGELVVRTYALRRLFPGFRMLRHIARAALPVLPAVLAVLAVRALGAASRTPGQALAELAVFGVATAIATLVLERRLIREVVGYVRGSGRPAGLGPASRPREAT